MRRAATADVDGGARRRRCTGADSHVVLSRLSIVTWNLQGSKGVDTAAVAGVIRAMSGGADVTIVGLQEVQRRHVRALARALDATDWRWTRKHLPYGPLLWWRAEGLAVIATVDLDDHRTRVLTSGVPLWSHRRRVLQQVAVDLDGVRLRLFNTHLASHGDRDERARQAAIVAGEIAMRRAEGDGVEVLVGDLNAPDEPVTLAPFAGIGLRDAWSAAGVGSGMTNPSGAPSQRLDYILAGPSVDVVGATVAGVAGIPWARLSDHLPLSVEASVEANVGGG